MARLQLAACLLLALVGVTRADRSLLAHKPNSGTSLHALAIGPYNYYLTNGNGTWVTALDPNSASTSGIYHSANSAFNKTANNTGAWGNAGAFAAILFPSSLGGSWLRGVTSAFFPSKSTGVAVASAQYGSATPSVLTTKDQGMTWQVVTGFSTNPWSSNTSVPGVGFPGYMVSGSAMQAPDLNAVTCVAQHCWAVGGYLPATPSLTSQPNFGVVFTSTTTGTYWTYYPLPGVAAIGGLSLAVGALFGVGADSTGKHIYAVGAPASVLSSTQVAAATGFTAPNASSSPQVQTYGSIVYSGTYGASWVVQTAPAIYNARYTLFGVTVIKGTVAYAVGGNEYVPSGSNSTTTSYASSNGIVIATTNGGFSWFQQPLSSQSVPIFLNGNPTPTYCAFANQTFPTLLGVANSATPVSRSAGAPVAGSVPNVTVWAVGASGVMLVSNLGPRTSMGMINSPIYGAQSFFSQVYQPAYPYGLDLVGIVWDNNLVGYAWGDAIIISTHDGGNTWALETPNLLVTAGAAAGTYLGSNAVIASIAVVPTTY